jgi:peptidoglycan/LPS O-acetylase OafA/YrhL
VRTAGLVAPLALVVSVGLVIGAAVLFYRWVEEPSMQLGRALAGAYERRTSPNPGGHAG